MFETFVKKVAGSVAVNGRNRERIAETEIIEFIEFCGRSADSVAFVYTENNGFSAFEEHGSNICVVCGHAGIKVGNKDDNIRAFNCDICLDSHFGKDSVIGFRFDTAGIDKHNGVIEPFTFAVESVPGNAGGIFHDCKALAGKLIEKGGFTYVRTTHDCNNRFCHFYIPPNGIYP